MPEFKPNEVILTGFPSNCSGGVFKRLFSSGRGKARGMVVDIDKNGIAYVVDGTSRTKALINAGLGDVPVNYKVRRRNIEPPDLSYLE